MAETEVKVTTVYPCCGKKAYFTFNPQIPQERYERICRKCGVAYQVKRKVLVSKKNVVLINRFEWLDKADDEYIKQYGQAKIIQTEEI